ncbi:hypothetical protein KJ763_01570 [Patescibacteria group bacterium]|nr:hypothetical protein [Patescibacteria group bacterium]
MLSIFPELFNYSFLAPFILRIILALVLIRLSYSSAIRNTDKYQRAIDITLIISAVLIGFGFLTQLVSLVIIAMIIIEVIKANAQKNVINRKSEKLLMIAIAISLMLLGPGMFAIDLPL